MNLLQTKLIAIDLDGTTLNKQAQVSPKTKAVLQKVQDQGHIVSIVTGRPYRMTRDIYDYLELKTPLINFNGALGHIPHQSWDKEYQVTFSKEIAFNLLADKKRLGLKVIAAEGKFMNLADQPNNFIDDFFPAKLETHQVLNHLNLQEDPAAMTMLVDKEQLPDTVKQLEKDYGQDINVGVWGGPTPILELSPKGIDKAHGVEFLAHHYGIKRQDIIAFGDEHNDYAMIDYVGHGVVMQNGTEQLKSIANDITQVDNDHDGLALYLEDYLNLKDA